MSKKNTMRKGLLLAAWLPGLAGAGNVTVDPDLQVFGQVLLGATAASQTLTVTNGGSTTVTLGSSALGGPAASEFTVGGDNCSGQSLAPAASCTVEVKFSPLSTGAKAATWSTTMSGGESGTLTAFLANYESSASEVKRRIAPVMVTVTLPTTIQAGTSSDIVWELEGYHGGYESMVVFFDCQGVASDCGASYSDATRFATSGLLAAESTGAGTWSYLGQTTGIHRFRYTFTPDASRFPSGGTVVARFYYKSLYDLDKNSLSLLVPGGLSGVNYYDGEGRRLSLTVTP